MEIKLLYVILKEWTAGTQIICSWQDQFLERLEIEQITDYLHFTQDLIKGSIPKMIIFQHFCLHCFA